MLLASCLLIVRQVLSLVSLEVISGVFVILILELVYGWD